MQYADISTSPVPDEQNMLYFSIRGLQSEESLQQQLTETGPVLVDIVPTEGERGREGGREGGWKVDEIQ